MFFSKLEQSMHKRGETTFSKANFTQIHSGVKVRTRLDNKVLFYNVLIDGNMDDLSQGSSRKVENREPFQVPGKYLGLGSNDYLGIWLEGGNNSFL